MPRLDDKIAKEEERRERRDDLDHEHDGIVPEGAGIELCEARQHRRAPEPQGRSS
jgi:hypothetical protein